MKALISPNEFCVLIVAKRLQDGTVEFTEEQGGQRVAQVELDENIFPVAEPLFWISCSNDCNPNDWHYVNGTIALKPPSELPPIVPPTNVEELP